MPKFLSYDAMNSILLAEFQFSVKNNQNLHYVLYSICDVTQCSFMEQLMQLFTDIPYKGTVRKKTTRNPNSLSVAEIDLYQQENILNYPIAGYVFFPLYSTHTEK